MLKRILGNRNILVVGLIVFVVIVGTVLIVSFPKDTEKIKKPTMDNQTEQNQGDNNEHIKEDVQSNESAGSGESNKSNDGLSLYDSEKEETVEENRTIVPDIWDDGTDN